MLINLILYISAFSLGYYINSVIRLIQVKKELSKNEKIYKELHANILSNLVTFDKRINNYIYLLTNLESVGDVSILYNIDNKVIYIFKKNIIIYMSNLISKTLLNDIISTIEYKFKNEIDDIVEIFGSKISRIFIEKNLKINNLNISGTNTNTNINKEEDESDINKIIHSNSLKFNIDDILDKINKLGIKSLSQDEVKYLNDFSKK